MNLADFGVPIIEPKHEESVRNWHDAVTTASTPASQHDRPRPLSHMAEKHWGMLESAWSKFHSGAISLKGMAFELVKDSSSTNELEQMAGITAAGIENPAKREEFVEDVVKEGNAVYDGYVSKRDIEAITYAVEEGPPLPPRDLVIHPLYGPSIDAKTSPIVFNTQRIYEKLGGETIGTEVTITYENDPNSIASISQARQQNSAALNAYHNTRRILRTVRQKKYRKRVKSYGKKAKKYAEEYGKKGYAAYGAWQEYSSKAPIHNTEFSLSAKGVLPEGSALNNKKNGKPFHFVHLDYDDQDMETLNNAAHQLLNAHFGIDVEDAVEEADGTLNVNDQYEISHFSTDDRLTRVVNSVGAGVSSLIQPGDKYNEGGIQVTVVNKPATLGGKFAKNNPDKTEVQPGTKMYVGQMVIKKKDSTLDDDPSMVLFYFTDNPVTTDNENEDGSLTFRMKGGHVDNPSDENLSFVRTLKHKSKGKGTFFDVKTDVSPDY